MSLVLVVIGLALLAVPGIVPEPPRRLPAREWTPIAFVAFGAGMLALGAGLFLAAVPTIAIGAGIPALVDRCRDLLLPWSTESTIVGWSAAGIAIAITLRFASGTIRSANAGRRARVEPWLGTHHRRDDCEVVIVPTERVLAFGVPGRVPQIVISTGLTEALNDDELEGVIEHERAHLRLHHPAMIAVLRGIESSLGRLTFVARSLHRLRAGVELWADTAADRDGPLGHPPLAAALAHSADPGVNSGVTRSIRDRANRLERKIRPRPTYARLAIYAPVIILIVVVTVTAIGWFTNAHHASALGDPCLH